MSPLLPVARRRARSSSLGRSFRRAAAGIGPLDTPAELHAVVFGAVLHAWGLELDDGLDVYAFQAVRQQLSAAQRLGKIVQSTLHDLLDRLKPAVRAAVAASWIIAREQISSFTPCLVRAWLAHSDPG